MRILFFGTTDFSRAMLKALIEGGHEIAGVVTLPDQPDSRGHRAIPTPVKLLAKDFDLKVFEAENLKDPSFAESLEALKADIGVVVSFKILPRAVFTAPRLGTLNVHPSLLPKLRGPAPVRWALIEGLAETGVTTFILDEKVDTGDIILAEPIEIPLDFNYAELFERIIPVAERVMLHSLELVQNGTYCGKKQNPSEATKAPKLTPEFCRIDWNKPASELHNLVRALSPEPGAWTELDGTRFKVLKARQTDESGSPGEILSCSPRTGLIIACGSGALEILQIQAPGKKSLECGAFLCGCKLSKGKVCI